MVPYILPSLKGKYNHGGVAGTGLDTETGEAFTDKNGRLLLTRLLEHFKARLIEDYRTRGKLLPSELNRSTVARRRIQQEKRAFLHEPLSQIMATLPFNPTSTAHVAWPAFDEEARLLSPPPGFDYLNAHVDILDFDMNILQADGSIRPYVRIPPVFKDMVAIPRAPSYIPSVHEFEKEVRVFQPVHDGDPGSKLSAIEKRDIVRFLQHNTEFKRGSIHCTDTRGRYIDFDEIDAKFDLCPVKWKAMDLSYPTNRQSYAGLPGFIQKIKFSASGSNVTGEGFTTRSDKERSSSYVQFTDSTSHATVPKRGSESLIGVVRFFLSLDVTGLDRYGLDIPESVAERYLVLAYVDRFLVEETSDGFLLRISETNTRAVENSGRGSGSLVEFINAIDITDMVGFLKCNDQNYVIWKDGCWTSNGRDMVIRQALYDMKNKT